MNPLRLLVSLSLLLGVLPSLLFSAPANHRTPLNDAVLRASLENMV